MMPPPRARTERPMTLRPSTSSALENYLQDHLIGAETGCAVAERAARYHANRPSGALLSRLYDDLEDDRHALLATMSEVGCRARPFSRVAGRMAEVISRVKRLELRGHTASSRLQELEMLLIGSRGRQGLWAALGAHFGEVAWAKEMAFEAREVRAQRHCEDLDRARVEAAREAFAESTRPG